MRIYVASSWRNPHQPKVVNLLRGEGEEVEVYDFRNPDGETGFHWSDVMEGFDGQVQLCPKEAYIEALEDPLSEAGFKSDFQALQDCDVCVLVLPCGRSAHLELGWAVGAGKKTAIMLDPFDPMVTPELMYKMVDRILPSPFDLLDWIHNV